MKRLTTKIFMILLTSTFLFSCSTNEVPVSDTSETTVVETSLADTMAIRVEKYRNGEIVLTEADSASIDKVAEALSNTDSLNLKGCPWYKDIECSAALAAAVVACGGPEDIPCIVAALGAMSSCIDCL